MLLIASMRGMRNDHRSNSQQRKQQARLFGGFAFTMFA